MEESGSARKLCHPQVDQPEHRYCQIWNSRISWIISLSITIDGSWIG